MYKIFDIDQLNNCNILELSVFLFSFSFETTKDLRNRQNSLSKSMLKATGSLLQGDALLIKSTIGTQNAKIEEVQTIIVEPPKIQGNLEGSSDPNPRELCNLQAKPKLKLKDRALDKELKNASNFDDMRHEGRVDLKLSERDEMYDKDDDKTPTNEISISSINEMTDNSVFKESLESEKQVLLLADDLKNELIVADEEKDDDNSERNKFVNAWVARLACDEKGTIIM